MSVMKSLIETMAHFVLDQERDPLLDHDGFLGKPIDRVDAQLKVKGEAQFTAEFEIPGLVHAALAYSTIAKGKVPKIDTVRAKGCEGVLEVFTYKNIPGMAAPPLVDMTDLKKGMAASDLPILQDSSVHWDGQPVAVVVAETLEQAEHAAWLVEVEYMTARSLALILKLKPDEVRVVAPFVGGGFGGERRTLEPHCALCGGCESIDASGEAAVIARGRLQGRGRPRASGTAHRAGRYKGREVDRCGAYGRHSDHRAWALCETVYVSDAASVCIAEFPD
jgi:hypothetical protein